MGKVILGCKGVSFSYNGKKVLEGVDVAIKSGEVVSICGPNGSGKTTLLRVLNGVLEPKKGKVQLDGKDLTALKPRDVAKVMAMVPQESHFEFDFTVEEVVSMGRTPHQGLLSFTNPEDRRSVERAMEITEVLKMRSKSINRLSGGEKQRAVVARALAQEPQLMLLDEPVSNLDIKHQFKTMKMLHKLNKKNGLALVMVLHDLQMAADNSDRLILMRGGRVVANGSPSAVLTRKNIKKVFGVDAVVTGGKCPQVVIKGVSD